MTDEAYSFVERNRELKSAASGARHRVSGSKTSYVGLPSDHLTPAQLRARNGPVTVLRLNAPMSYGELLALSPEHRRLYLEHLITEYGASQRMLAGMLRCSVPTLNRRLSELRVQPRKRGGRISSAVHARWQSFLSGAYGADGGSGTTGEESRAGDVLNTAEEEQTPPDTASTRLRDVALTVENVRTWEDLRPYVVQLLSRGLPTTVRIEMSLSRRRASLTSEALRFPSYPPVHSTDCTRTSKNLTTEC